MCAPVRYTSRQRSVKRIFSFSSGTLKRFGMAGAVTGSGLDGAARLLDLGAGGGGDGDALDDELARHVAHAEQLDRVVGPAHQPRAEQRLGRDLDAVGERAEMAHVHDLRRLLERVREAALGDAADQRHLAALEAGPRAAARARGLALAAPARRLAQPRARAAPLAAAGAVRAARRLEPRQRQLRHFGLLLRLRHHALPRLAGVTSTRCRTWYSIPRSAG